MIRNIDGVEYYSQFLQDYFLNLEIFKNKKDGSFVEFGAYDGITHSNSYFFEKTLNWHGICIEPTPDSFSLLKKNRGCDCVWGAVTANNEHSIELWQSIGTNKVNSCIKGSPGNALTKYGEFITVPAYNINSILRSRDLFDLDYMSIDIEGNEIDIVKSIDLDTFRIKAITVENLDNNRLSYDYLLQNGYKYYHRIFIDDLFIRI